MKFRAALGFFTRLPVGSAPLPPTFQGVIVWLPAIGLIVGLLAALAVALATLLLPAQLGGVIGCLVWVFITGGLHLDGVADCGDGLLVEAPPERRLEIKKCVFHRNHYSGNSVCSKPIPHLFVFKFLPLLKPFSVTFYHSWVHVLKFF